MHKVFRLSGLFLFILALCVCGCSGSSADPMGTGTVQFVDESITSTGTSAAATVITTAQVEPNSSLTLTVWVSNFTNEGKVVPVIGENVTFTLDSPENGAGLAVLNDRTASNGQARVIYTAGNNLFQDVVRVTTSVGATASITITKTGILPIGSVVALSATPTSVAPLGFSTITATVTDPTTDPTNPVAVKGERVTFTMLTNNGAFLSIQSGLTNASGQVIATYQAGYNDSQDVIQAYLSNGATAQVIITVTSIVIPPVPPVPPVPLSIEVKALPTSVSAGQVSIVTATLTGDGNVGVTVTFSLPINNSGASLSASSAITDGAGNAVVTYRAGANSPTLTVSDTVKASVGSISSSAAITRLGAGVPPPPTPLSIEVKALPTSVSAGQVSIITATLTGDDNAGVTVTFSLPVNNSGATLSASSAITDGAGKAVVIYYPGANTPTIEVQDVVQAAVGSAKDSATIKRTGTGVTGYTVTLTPPGDFIGGWTGQTVQGILTARVTNSSSQAVSGMTVTFSIASGGGDLTSATAVTNASGDAVTSFSRLVSEPAGTVIFVFFKAKLPDGTETIARLRIDA